MKNLYLFSQRLNRYRMGVLRPPYGTPPNGFAWRPYRAPGRQIRKERIFIRGLPARSR